MGELKPGTKEFGRDFRKDLKISEAEVKKFMYVINKLYPHYIIEQNNDWKYDLKLTDFTNNKELKIEIKDDFKCCSTGNVAIEYQFNNNPSGIEHTEADYWVITIHNNDRSVDSYNIIDVNVLKEIVKECRKVPTSRPATHTWIYLLPKELLKQNCKVIMP